MSSAKSRPFHSSPNALEGTRGAGVVWGFDGDTPSIRLIYISMEQPQELIREQSPSIVHFMNFIAVISWGVKHSVPLIRSVKSIWRESVTLSPSWYRRKVRSAPNVCVQKWTNKSMTVIDELLYACAKILLSVIRRPLVIRTYAHCIMIPR